MVHYKTSHLKVLELVIHIPPQPSLDLDLLPLGVLGDHIHLFQFKCWLFALTHDCKSCPSSYFPGYCQPRQSIPSVVGIEDISTVGEVTFRKTSIRKKTAKFQFKSSANSLKRPLSYRGPKSAQYSETQLSTRFVSRHPVKVQNQSKMR